MAATEEKELTPIEFNKALNAKLKEADKEAKSKSNAYLDKLEKYHIAGQHGMSAPKPPKGNTVDPVALRSQLEGGDVKDEEIVHPIAEGGGRISPEKALELAGKEHEGIGGRYHAQVEEPETEEVEEDDEDTPTHKPAPTPKPQTPPQPPPTPPKRSGD